MAFRIEQFLSKQRLSKQGCMLKHFIVNYNHAENPYYITILDLDMQDNTSYVFVYFSNLGRESLERKIVIHNRALLSIKTRFGFFVCIEKTLIVRIVF